MPDTTTPFARRLRSLREAAGLTQQQLADATGIERPNVARLEAGGRAPAWETVCRLARALGVGTESFREPE